MVAVAAILAAPLGYAQDARRRPAEQLRADHDWTEAEFRTIAVNVPPYLLK